MLVTTIPLNYYTTSLMLQQVMEKPLEKKAGKNFGPPGTKKLVYFIDDMNMPEVDTYGTVQPHTLIRQVCVCVCVCMCGCGCVYMHVCVRVGVCGWVCGCVGVRGVGRVTSIALSMS